MKKLIIAPILMKNKILKSIYSEKKIINIKISNFDEIKKKLYFDFDYKTIYELMNHYHFKYDVALVYLNNLYNICDYDNIKMNKLKEIKQFLDKKKLLIYDDNFINYIKNFSIEITGYYKLTHEQLKIIENLKKY